MTWNIVSDSSCDLRMAGFESDRVRFETVPLRLQVGEKEFVDNDGLEVPKLLAAMAAEKTASSTAWDTWDLEMPRYSDTSRAVSHSGLLAKNSSTWTSRMERPVRSRNGAN